jgi:formamidase
VVHILDIGTKEDMLWAFNGFVAREKGGGLLTDHCPKAQKSIWDFEGMFAHSRHVPGVRHAGLIHPGLIGCLPDPAMLDMWNGREKKLLDTEPDRVPPQAALPNTQSAHMGAMKGEIRDQAAAEGARTVPPREHGGNCDITDLSRGATIDFPSMSTARASP